MNLHTTSHQHYYTLSFISWAIERSTPMAVSHSHGKTAQVSEKPWNRDRTDHTVPNHSCRKLEPRYSPEFSITLQLKPLQSHLRLEWLDRRGETGRGRGSGDGRRILSSRLTRSAPRILGNRPAKAWKNWSRSSGWGRAHRRSSLARARVMSGRTASWGSRSFHLFLEIMEWIGHFGESLKPVQNFN